MRSLSDFLYKYTNWLTCVLSTAIMVAYASIAMGHAGAAFEEHVPDGFKVLDLKVAYSAEYVGALFDAMGPEGLKGYLKMVQVWDNIFPLVYGLMNLFLMSLIFKPIVTHKPVLRFINLLPLIPMIFDWIENALAGRLVLQFLNTGQIETLDVSIASTFTLLKWTATYLTFLTAAIGIGMLIYFKASGKRRHENVQ